MDDLSRAIIWCPNVNFGAISCLASCLRRILLDQSCSEVHFAACILPNTIRDKYVEAALLSVHSQRKRLLSYAVEVSILPIIPSCSDYFSIGGYNMPARRAVCPFVESTTHATSSTEKKSQTRIFSPNMVQRPYLHSSRQF